MVDAALPYILSAVLAYLLGNVQFAVIFSRALHHDDVRKYGSGNAGSTNMLRVYGAKSGLITFIGDFGKGMLAVFLGRWIAGEICGYIAALFVVLGHCYPILSKLRGGKGVASTFGILCVIKPLYALAITAVCFAMLLLTRTVSIVSLTGATLFLLLAVAFSRGNVSLIITAALLWALIVARHRDNILRIINKEESKVLQKRPKEKKNANTI
ncbi:MAG: glycerol-3-phosphate 1-O-acyltransferase PlsY [Clostridiales bacterium]|jgi:glycerol-3-phosphate acyltransferase PlsY|nr:glycerol-3-phosphate 1-O-acyltransferase PlsY [Clostridiales bacterium]